MPHLADGYYFPHTCELIMSVHHDFKIPESVLRIYPELNRLDDNASRQAALCVYSLNRTLRNAWRRQRELPGHPQNWLPPMLEILETSLADLRTTAAAGTLPQFLTAELHLFAQNNAEAQVRLSL